MFYGQYSTVPNDREIDGWNTALAAAANIIGARSTS
jgi:hypothetical protein